MNFRINLPLYQKKADIFIEIALNLTDLKQTNVSVMLYHLILSFCSSLLLCPSGVFYSFPHSCFVPFLISIFIGLIGTE